MRVIWGLYRGLYRELIGIILGLYRDYSPMLHTKNLVVGPSLWGPSEPILLRNHLTEIMFMGQIWHHLIKNCSTLGFQDL